MSDTATITRRISLAADVDLLPLLGRNDDHLKTLEHELDVRIVARGHEIMLRGDERQVRRAERALTQLAELVRSGTPVRSVEVRAALRMLAEDEEEDEEMEQDARKMAEEEDEEEDESGAAQRGSAWAGVEIGSGLIINQVPPEEAAAFYRTQLRK